MTKLKQGLPVCALRTAWPLEDDHECPARVKAVKWEGTEEQVMEEPYPSLVAALLLQGERCSTTSGVACPYSGWIPLV